MNNSPRYFARTAALILFGNKKEILQFYVRLPTHPSADSFHQKEDGVYPSYPRDRNAIPHVLYFEGC